MAVILDKSKLILERWKAGISKEDRKHDKLNGLFDNLFMEMAAAQVVFDDAYLVMKIATKLLYPDFVIVKNVYAKSSKKKYQSLQEFQTEWNGSVDKISIASFYTFYQIEGTDRPVEVTYSNVHKSVISISDTPINEAVSGMKTEDEMNEEDFWKCVKSVTREHPWLFAPEDGPNDRPKTTSI